jgi:carbamoylphosphate synthase large subunit
MPRVTSKFTHTSTFASIEIDIPAAHSTAVSTVSDALNAAKEIGYPVILRSAFSLGGLGSGFAQNEEELRDLSAKSLSLSPQVLIEKSLKGWKEVEYEVVRDAADSTYILNRILRADQRHDTDRTNLPSDRCYHLL